MASYQFRSTKDGSVLPLTDVDNLMREALGLPLSPDKYCTFFNVAVDVGFAILMGGGTFVTQYGLDTLLRKAVERDVVIPPADIALIQRFLIDEFTFYAWR